MRENTIAAHTQTCMDTLCVYGCMIFYFNFVSSSRFALLCSVVLCYAVLCWIQRTALFRGKNEDHRPQSRPLVVRIYMCIICWYRKQCALSQTSNMINIHLNRRAVSFRRNTHSFIACDNTNKHFEWLHKKNWIILIRAEMIFGCDPLWMNVRRTFYDHFISSNSVIHLSCLKKLIGNNDSV